MRRDWKARTTKNGVMVFSANMSDQFCAVSGSKGSFADIFFVKKSGSRREVAKPALGKRDQSAPERKGTENRGDELIHENVKLAIDSSDVLSDGVHTLLVSRIHLESGCT